MKIHAVESSEAALSYLSTNESEIVLCDFNLPGISGEALFEKLLATGNKATPRFVFMTGDLVDPALVSRYREKGARILQKPFSVAMLAALMAELLQIQSPKRKGSSLHRRSFPPKHIRLAPAVC